MFSKKIIGLGIAGLLFIFGISYLSPENTVFAQQRGERLKKILERRKNPQQGNAEAKQEIRVDGKRRSFLVHLPRGYDSNKRIPLVLAFHGGGGNAQNMLQMSGFNKKADDENFIVVYPNGLGRMENILLTFNAGGCCDYAMEQNIDDVKFVSELIDTLVEKYPVDKNRVYATGFSNGALLSHRLAAELPDKIAAIAPVAGALFDSSPPAKGKVAVLIIHGLADTAVPYKGGYSERELVSKRQREPFKSLDYGAQFWAKANGCNDTPAKSVSGKITRERYSGCAGNNDVEVLTISDGLHAWPGGQKGREQGDAPSTAISATDAIWDFFKSHRR